ncbi:MAG: immune inhibitor A, partial [Akkermansiaceae bacterium]|nr:immune inhibitor A [Akkermansiaceae bacterium]MCF7732764.1 immune inhibitor A [Akkermansiaceae bacterium]
MILATAAAADPLTDQFESSLGQWQATGSWGLTTTRAVSPSHSVTDSPGAYYTNNSNSALTLATAIDLTATPRPALAFRHAHELEKSFDFGLVEISTDGGGTWSPTALGTYTGSQPGFFREQLDLDAFAAASNVKFRFRMTTDSSIVMDGWYLDDVVVGSAPEAVELQTPSAPDIAQTSATLHWSASADPDFSAYVILRSTQAGFDWRTAKTVTTITDAATVDFTDIAVAPKSSYHYRVMTLTGRGLHSLSNEISAATPSGMDYPFLDDGEGGSNLWVAAAPWAIADEDSARPGGAWSDSPGGNYADAIASQPLTLAAPMDLTSASDPILTFHHRYTLASGDTANIEVSTNQGSSWTSLATYSTGTVAWTRVRVPLAAYAGQSSVLLRFRLTTNASTNADGWHLDDISVAEAPSLVAAPALDEITSHGMRLTWNANASLPFSHYAIHRSTSSGVGINSERVAMITDQAQTSFTDTGLALDTLYYYRVYAVSPYGTYSADSLNEASARTLNNPLPFAEDFDGDLLAWNTGSDTGTNVWGLSTAVKRTGNSCLASSPGASYAQNTNTYIETSADLRATEWPVLTFWDRFGLNSGDWFRLEITAAGGPTVYTYGAYESSRSEWQRQRIDLSPWKGLSNVKLRFRLVSNNAATPGDG